MVFVDRSFFLQQYIDDVDYNEDWIVVEERRRKPDLMNLAAMPATVSRALDVGL